MNTLLAFEMSLTDQDWYSEMDWAFAIAENLYLLDPSLIPDHWEYAPSILGIALESYKDQIIREMVTDGNVTASDLIEAGNTVIAWCNNNRPEGE